MGLLGLMATYTVTTTRRLTEVGYLIGAIGAIGIGAGHWPRPSRPMLGVAGAVLLALGLGLVIIALHYGR